MTPQELAEGLRKAQSQPDQGLLFKGIYLIELILAAQKLEELRGIFGPAGVKHIHEILSDRDAAFATVNAERETIVILREALKVAKETVKFYATRANWKAESYSSDCLEIIRFDDLGCKSYTDDSDFSISAGGRRAREALAAIDKVLKDGDA